MKFYVSFFLAVSFLSIHAQEQIDPQEEFTINSQEYFEMSGANVMLAHDFYPESHQGGVGLIQNGIRVATNGDLRLEPTPGQWQPVPKVGKRQIDRDTQEISVKMTYPDETKNRTGFNPILYPDLELTYTLKVKAQGKSFKIIVDLDEPLPEAWIGKVGMNIELFPGILFGKTYYMDNTFGIFNRQANGPGYNDEDGEFQLSPMASGKVLVVAPDDENQTLRIENLQNNGLQLIDGRARHSNGWFVVRSLVPAGKTKNAIEWLVTPSVKENFIYEPVVQISQVGYHPNQDKIAVIETDKNDDRLQVVKLFRVNNEGGLSEVLSGQPERWGDFLRYTYYHFDFSKVKEPGMYKLTYGDFTTRAFQISAEVYKRHVWQPTLEYFLPVQMCHMRVNDRYKVWHGRCHLDDARMAPTDFNHFDGYKQGSETLTSFKSGEHVPGIDIGGWHDAGDYDLRVESQAGTVQGLSHIYELFKVDHDNTSIDQNTKTVEMFRPDGKSDILQQIEHGVLTIVGGYTSLGRFYRGIIVPHKRQYVLLGDPVNHSDNTDYSNTDKVSDIDVTSIEMGKQGAADDRWVFTEDNPRRTINTAAALAAASRVLNGYNQNLADKCLKIATDVWEGSGNDDLRNKIELAVELLKTTDNQAYAKFITDHITFIKDHIDQTGWVVGPVLPLIDSKAFSEEVRSAVKNYAAKVYELEKETPYGIVYKPNIWGAGWGIQNFGMKQYYFHTSYPDIIPNTYMLNAMNFILGVHPGVNTSSFASGVGARSLTQAYGVNRGDFSFIPGGIGSGTALIRPDFPELLEWPFLWQQTEYVLGGGTTDYMFLILAADQLLNKE